LNSLEKEQLTLKASILKYLSLNAWAYQAVHREQIGEIEVGLLRFWTLKYEIHLQNI
jgi:hypothetical protein